MSGLTLFDDVSREDDGARSDFDFYETPSFMVRSLLHYQRELRTARILECCSGRDAITLILRAYGATVLTNDIDTRHPAMTHGDATLDAYWREVAAWPELPDWIVTNPPFDKAMDILKRALPIARQGVIMLLRKTFLEPTLERGPWLAQYPPVRCIGQPRYPFRGGATDSVSCDWMVWKRSGLALIPAFPIDFAAERRVRNEL